MASSWRSPNDLELLGPLGPEPQRGQLEDATSQEVEDGSNHAESLARDSRTGSHLRLHHRER
jgi:hypothetical protein